LEKKKVITKINLENNDTLIKDLSFKKSILTKILDQIKVNINTLLQDRGFTETDEKIREFTTPIVAPKKEKPFLKVPPSDVVVYGEFITCVTKDESDTIDMLYISESIDENAVSLLGNVGTVASYANPFSYFGNKGGKSTKKIKKNRKRKYVKKTKRNY